MTQLLLICAAVLILYVMGRLTLGAIPPRVDGPTLRAAISATYVFFVGAAAVVCGRPRLALHLPVAAATCAMTFGVAALILGRRLPDGVQPENRSWGLLLPAVALTMIGGWVGRVDPLLIACLVAFGTVALLAWRTDPPGEASDEPRRAPQSVIVWWLAGIGLSVLAGILAVVGLPGLESSQRWSADALVAAFLLTPALVVPMFFELMPPCRSISWSGSVSALAKFALLNLCFVLPLVAWTDAHRAVVHHSIGWATESVLPSVTSTTAPASTLPSLTSTSPTTRRTEVRIPNLSPIPGEYPGLPGVVMRADLLALAGAALLLIPLGAGWLRPGRLEAFALLAVYMMNLFLVMASVVR